MRDEDPEAWKILQALLWGLLNSCPDKVQILQRAIGGGRESLHEGIEELIDAGMVKILMEDTGDEDTSGYRLGVFNPFSGEYVPF